ncbi:hypothetical protein ABFS83_01G021100 [Erythranthe nasuta]
MASIRRTLSPVPRPGALMNGGEASQVASPLSKSSSNAPNYPPNSGPLSSSFDSLDYALYKSQNFILSIFSQRSSRPFDRSKLKGKIWRKAFLHFLMCFIVGIFIGLTPFFPLDLSANVVSKNQVFNELYGSRKEMSTVGRFSPNENSTSQKLSVEFNDGTLDNSSNWGFEAISDKLLIIVTPSHARPIQAYYLNRLAHTLKRVPHPVLWIVVEMNYQSVETAELLRNTGLMYRHLVCSRTNSTEITDNSANLRNVALSHIEAHRLDGIVYFADDDNIYSTGVFEQMRKISRIGIWVVAKLVENEGDVFFDGPICNSSRVIGWHVADVAKRSRRFHAEMSGFAFNSTIIWDPKRWHRPTIEPIRQIETVKEVVQASTFIEQIVEDESQMECFPTSSSRIMVWHRNNK